MALEFSLFNYGKVIKGHRKFVRGVIWPAIFTFSHVWDFPASITSWFFLFFSTNLLSLPCKNQLAKVGNSALFSSFRENCCLQTGKQRTSWNSNRGKNTLLHGADLQSRLGTESGVFSHARIFLSSIRRASLRCVDSAGTHFVEELEVKLWFDFTWISIYFVLHIHEWSVDDWFHNIANLFKGRKITMSGKAGMMVVKLSNPVV